jgi:hypothetical protein
MGPLSLSSALSRTSPCFVVFLRPCAWNVASFIVQTVAHVLLRASFQKNLSIFRKLCSHPHTTTASAKGKRREVEDQNNDEQSHIRNAKNTSWKDNAARPACARLEQDDRGSERGAPRRCAGACPGKGDRWHRFLMLLVHRLHACHLIDISLIVL